MTKTLIKNSRGTATLSASRAPRRNALKLAVSAGLVGWSLMAAQSAHAFGFDLFDGKVSGRFDTTLSYGISLRTNDPDSDLIGKAFFDPLIGTRSNAEQRAATGRFSVNSDDGNLNFGDKWDVVSNNVKALSELELSYENYGFFGRASYFRDFAYAGKDRFTRTAKSLVGDRFQLLDAYFWADFDFDDQFATLRVGRQVVSWGESTFIQNGINVVNAVDVGKLRTAGSELREAFLPQNMIWGSYSFNENLSLEGLLIFEFEQIDPEPAGTFFSTNDFATPGGLYAMLNFGLVPQPVQDIDDYNAVCRSGQFLAPGCAVAVSRNPDVTPDDDPDQFGFALRYYSPELNDTEFGLYYLRYHSRLPLINGFSITDPSPSSARFFISYPEDIDLFGASFNTTAFNQTLSIAGEVSYRDGVPLQIDDVELLFAGLTPLNPLIPDPANRFTNQLGEFEPGQPIQGFERFDVTQAQVTFTKLFGSSNPFGADQIAMVGEIGATKVWDLPDKSVLRFNGPGTDTGGGPDVLSGNLRNPQTQTSGFADSFSWGYRFLTRFDYNSAFGTAITVSPQIAFNHDVNGTTPGPGGNFVEDRKSVTLQVGFNYLNNWSGLLAYTNFFGAGNQNLLSDRDFVSAVVRYAF
jgi:hypothetical protein